MLNGKVGPGFLILRSRGSGVVVSAFELTPAFNLSLFCRRSGANGANIGDEGVGVAGSGFATDEEFMSIHSLGSLIVVFAFGVCN